MKGRIVKGVGGLYIVDTAEGFVNCKPRGLFRKKNIKPLVGDFVIISVQDEVNNEGTIDEILPRKNELIRPQVANLDLSVLVFAAADPTINTELLDRLIILSEKQELQIIIVINKTDLINESDFDYLKEIYKNTGYEIMFISTVENDNKAYRLFEILKDKVSVFSGPSGVGKSSITNLFVAEKSKMETGEISRKLKRGKHTTRHAELFKIGENTFVVDSPGFTSIDLATIEISDLQYLFAEFRSFLGHCKFNDCQHVSEPGCAVREQVGKNISKERYERYLYFLNEANERKK